MLPDSDSSYWADGDLETPESCPVCLSIELSVLYGGLSDMEEGVPGRWDVLQCDQCCSLILSPRPKPEKINKAYRTYYTHRPPLEENLAYTGTSTAWRLIDGYINRKYGDGTRRSSALGAAIVRMLPPLRQQLDYLYRHLPVTPGSLLDVGCGNGAFLLRAKSSGWHVQGLEPDPAASRRAVEHGLRVHPTNLSDFRSRETFDVVTLSHVIEHLHNPREALVDCFRRLKPGGCIWIATPNIRSIGHRLFKRAWQPLETPRHLVMPSPSALRAMLVQVGFENVRFLRRGRGSRKRLEASSARARSMGLRARTPILWSQLIDFAASLNPQLGEELVIVATRPRRER